MIDLPKGITFDKPTKRENDLMYYLGNCIADWIEKNETEREELLCAFSLICSIMFTTNTPITDVEDQCKEIDAFCEFLKLRARNS
jgi:hypothetical protein